MRAALAPQPALGGRPITRHARVVCLHPLLVHGAGHPDGFATGEARAGADQSNAPRMANARAGTPQARSRVRAAGRARTFMTALRKGNASASS